MDGSIVLYAYFAVRMFIDRCKYKRINFNLLYSQCHINVSFSQIYFSAYRKTP